MGSTMTTQTGTGEKVGLLRVQGLRAMGIHCGVKREKLDLALIASDRPATAAGVFTQNAFAAAPVQVSRTHLGRGTVRAIVVNSGNANAATGAQGLADAREMAAITAEHLGVDPQEVLVSSTGMIGVPLPMEKIRAGIRACYESLDAGTGAEAAEAIRTTDSHPKLSHRAFTVQGREYIVAGMAKGSGMIHPNMATMLAFLATDAPVAASALDTATRHAVGRTFNMLTVDGDESTNDMVLTLATGAAGGDEIRPGAEGWEGFQEALTAVSRDLARMIAADGEGATRLMEVRVTGASSEEEARRAARAVARSSLVKSALHGSDPNWGRIVAAAGSAGVAMDPKNVVVSVSPAAPAPRPGAPAASTAGPAPEPVTLFAGTPAPENAKRAASAILAGTSVRFTVHLGVGEHSAEAWGCDLTEEYVRFNSAYTT